MQPHEATPTRRLRSMSLRDISSYRRSCRDSDSAVWRLVLPSAQKDKKATPRRSLDTKAKASAAAAPTAATATTAATTPTPAVHPATPAPDARQPGPSGPRPVTERRASATASPPVVGRSVLEQLQAKSQAQEAQKPNDCSQELQEKAGSPLRSWRETWHLCGV